MIKKSIKLMLLSIFLTGCIKAPVDNTPLIIIEDAMGRAVPLADYPDEIVIAGRQTPMLANFAYLFADSSEKIVGIENRSQSSDRFLSLLDDDYLTKVVIEKGAGAEQISPLEPDLVILKDVMKGEIGDQLETIGIQPIYVSFETIEDINRDMRILGEVFQDTEKAEFVIRFFEEKKSELDQMVQISSRKPDVLILQAKSAEGEIIFSVPPVNWLQTVMVDELKANAVWKGDADSGGWMDVNIEQIIAWNPELIIVINYQGQAQQIIEQLRGDDVWKTFLSASNCVIKPFPYDFQSWDQPDPRWILGYAGLAHFLYSDAVDAEVVYDIVQDFYQQLYGLDIAYIEAEIIPILKTQFE